MDNEETKKDIPIFGYRNNNLRYVSDESLELALTLLEKAQISVEEDEKDDDKIKINTNIVNLCKKGWTTKELLEKVKNSEEIFTEKITAFKVLKLYDVSGYTVNIDKLCRDCKFDKCPKRLVGYMQYLKENNLLEDELQDRKEFIEKNGKYSPFTFKWNYGDILRIIPDDLYELSYELVKKDLIYVENYLVDGYKNIKIYSNLPCNNNFKNAEERQMPLNQWWFAKVNPDNQPNICIPYSYYSLLQCGYDACPVIVAGIIYYLLKSNKEDELIKEREYYKEHQEEAKQKLEMLKKPLQEKKSGYNLDIIEKVLKIKLPTKFRNLYIYEIETIKDEIKLMTETEMLHEVVGRGHYDLRDLLVEYPFKKRVPFSKDDSENYIGLDYDTTDGKVVRYKYDEKIIEVLANSFDEYIEETKEEHEKTITENNSQEENVTRDNMTSDDLENITQQSEAPKEINQIYNKKVKNILANQAVRLLLEQKLINEEELKFAKVDFGYVFSKIDNVLEALYKVTIKEEKIYYFAAQKNKILSIDINENTYNETIRYMTKEHECLKKAEILETDLQKKRRLKNYELLSNNGIVASLEMPCIYDDANVQLKDIDLMCKKAIASLLVIQIACDINNNKYQEALDFFIPILKKFNVEEYLNEKEKRIIEGTYSRQDVIDMDWEYEAYWAICWCLGLVDDIKDASKFCDCNYAISLVMHSKSVEDFKNKCKVRSTSEILDMQDLYYRYCWAINEKQINNEVSIGNLNPSNVVERARGLEWVISKEFDWYKMRLNG